MKLRSLILPQLILTVLVLVWAWFARSEIYYRLDVELISPTVMFTAALVAVNFTLFKLGRHFGVAPAVYLFLENAVYPLVRGASLFSIVVVAVLAGFSEELLFRGLLQPRVGVLLASILFGAFHGPSFSLAPLGVWAAAVGGFLGVLYLDSGNLLVPMSIHGVYDFLALVYVRYWFLPRREQQTVDRLDEESVLPSSSP